VVPAVPTLTSKAGFGRWECPFQVGRITPVSQLCHMSPHAVLAGQPLGWNSQPVLTLSVDLQIRLSAADLPASASPISGTLPVNDEGL
jgi:hypothetical protein